jgi:DNA-binding response OmpR family regulator
MTRVLVVEDERDLAIGLRANLEIEGHEVSVASGGEDALATIRSRPPDLILLDLMLPGISGYEVLAELRRTHPILPVIILSARAEEMDKVRGFREGADDYVTKPFGVMELMLRVRAVLRRAAAPRDGQERRPAPLRIGGVDVDLENRLVSTAGGEVALTPKAAELLAALVARDGRAASRQDLLRQVWGYEASVTTRTVDAHVAELRRKIEADPANPVHILTVWKTGYRLRV